MIDCPECKGAGKIANNYRENAMVERSTEEKSFCIIDATGRWIKDWWPVIAVITMVSGIGYGGCRIINVLDEASAKAAAEQPKHGYLIVQYNDANEVQRCYISPSKDGDVTIVGKGIIVYMSDVDKPGAVPANVGVSDLSKCLRYQ